MSTRYRLMVLSTSVLAACGLFFLAGGCGNRNPKDAVDVKVSKDGAGASDLFANAVKVFREATEVQHFQDGLAIVNEYLNAAAAAEEVKKADQIRPLSEAEDKALRASLGLGDAEVQHLRETKFLKSEDAYHLDSCFLFRDAGKHVVVPGQARADKLRYALEWVSRHVLYHEQTDAGLPAVFVLRRGHGDALDRALVFLELIRQMDMIGCLVSAGTPGRDPFLVGVLGDDGLLHLFDTRLGIPVAGPGGKGTATLADALKEPALLKAHGVGDKVDQLRLRLPLPLAAFAPRMAFLQNKLTAHIRINLSEDVADLTPKLEAAGGVGVVPWETPDVAAPAPFRRAKLFLPGSVKGESPLAFLRYHQRLVPKGEIEFRLMQLRLFAPDDLHPLALNRLMRFVGEVFDKYLLQPRSMMLHGRTDEALRRLHRIIGVLDDLDLTLDPAKVGNFEARVEKWREKVNEVYHDLARKEKGAQKREAEIWGEDKYFQNLLDVEGEAGVLNRKEIGTITGIVMRVCRDFLAKESSYISALCLQDKADRQQAFLDKEGGKANAALRQDARDAWTSARSHWKGLLDRQVVTREFVQPLLALVEKRWQEGDQESAILILERVTLELHKGLFARYSLGRAEFFSGEKDAAVEQWTKLHHDIEGLAADKAWPALLERLRDGPRAGRVGLLLGDWQPRGAWATWLEKLDRELARAK